MKIFTALLLFAAFATAGCNTGTDSLIDREKEICRCIDYKYDSLGMDFKGELLQYEQHLVEKELLADTTGQSYVRIFQAAAKENKIPVATNYSIDGLTVNTFGHFVQCLYANRDDRGRRNSGSKINGLFRVSDSINATGNVTPAILAEAMLTVLDAADFEKDFYRMYALSMFYLADNSRVDNDSGDQTIDLTITKDEEIFLNDQLIPLDSVAVKINALTKDFSEEEMANHFIRMRVDPQVKMGLVVDVKEQLRAAKKLRVQYSTQ